MAIIDDEMRAIGFITKEVNQLYKGKNIPSEIALFICNQGTTELKAEELIDLSEEHASEIVSIGLWVWKHFLKNYEANSEEKNDIMNRKNEFLYADMEGMTDEFIQEMKKFLFYEYGNDIN